MVKICMYLHKNFVFMSHSTDHQKSFSCPYPKNSINNFIVELEALWEFFLVRFLLIHSNK